MCLVVFVGNPIRLAHVLSELGKECHSPKHDSSYAITEFELSSQLI